MNRYILPKIFCALGTFVILAGIFLSELNITLGNYSKSAIIAVLIAAGLLLFAISAFQMKTSHKKRCLKRLLKCKTVEYFGLVLFAISGAACLLIFNHCITVWQSTGDIKTNMNIRQSENMLPEYEKYANQRIENYKVQLSKAIRNKNSSKTELVNLGFDVNSPEDLKSQSNRKIDKLKQVVFPYIYDSLKTSIRDSIRGFIYMVENFSPITMPKNIIRMEEWTKHWEKQLNDFSHYRMKGEKAEVFHFESTFGNVEHILTYTKDYFSAKRYTGYGVGLVALLFMLFPYFWGNRSIKITKSKK